MIVFWFTHPLLTLLARLRFFREGHPWSGLDPRRLGVPQTTRYVGRGRFTPAPGVTASAAEPATAGKGGAA
jgi:preprotein translocase subunit SecD